MRLHEIAGHTDGAGLNIGIVVSTFNETITSGLLAGALNALEEAGIEECTVVRVPGALELGPAMLRLARSGRDAIIAIGAVIEGETDHYEHVATQASAAITQVVLATGIPVTSAVLTVREFNHARDRSLPGPGNKGAEAAKAAVTLVNALRQI
jgi:6,7-dimethyl-8-ribityllumazine synthase